MSEVVEEQQPEAAPVETPVTPAPAPEPSIDDLLAQYDREVPTPEPAPENVAPNGQDDSVEKILDELSSKDTERIAALEGEVNSLRSAEHQRAEREAFDKFSDELQGRLPEHCAPDHARNALLAMAATDPSLVAAFDVRNVSAAERQQAPALLQQAIQLYQQLQRTPDTDPRKQQALDWVAQRGRYLEAVVMGPGILRKAVREIEDRAHKFQPINAEAGELKSDIAWAMKGASSKRIADPPPNFGKMSANEGRKKVMDEFGFDPGWGH